MPKKYLPSVNSNQFFAIKVFFNFSKNYPLHINWYNYLEVTVLDFAFVWVGEFVAGWSQQIIFSQKFPEFSDLISVHTAIGQTGDVHLKVKKCKIKGKIKVSKKSLFSLATEGGKKNSQNIPCKLQNFLKTTTEKAKTFPKTNILPII